jgi:hypothetical protein
MFQEVIVLNLSNTLKDNIHGEVELRRSQWSSGLRHEPFSLARTLGSWIQIPHRGWMSVCVYAVFVLFCV